MWKIYDEINFFLLSFFDFLIGGYFLFFFKRKKIGIEVLNCKFFMQEIYFLNVIHIMIFYKEIYLVEDGEYL